MLKDWIKIREFGEGSILYRQKLFPKFELGVFRNHKIGGFNVDSDNPKFKERHFKTREQAIKFAKNYMRKH